jgi:hypothetical protein
MTLAKTITFPELGIGSITVTVHDIMGRYIWSATDDDSQGVDFFVYSSVAYDDRHEALGAGILSVTDTFAPSA